MRNEVILTGRVAMTAVERQLPSGDVVVTTRVVVDRPGRRNGSGSARSRQRVDAIDCVAWTARAQRTIRGWQPGDQVYIEGSIRRRFFRADGGAVSRVEVEVTKARRASADEAADPDPAA
jgi:single-strand DNA-binding protein